jgi:hypothetical protein
MQLLTFKDTTDGIFRSACNRQYFMSAYAKNQLDAEIECCKYGLKLWSIDSAEELACFAEMNAGWMKILIFCHYKNL